MGRSSTTKKSEPRDAASKLAQSRLSVIELAGELGNVAEACRRRGLDRTSFYEWKGVVAELQPLRIHIVNPCG
jgi:hypothetical protein